MKKILFILFVYTWHLADGIGQTGIQLSNPIFFQNTKTPMTILTKNKYRQALAAVKQQKQPTQIPMAYCYNNLAFFCKIEVKMEKASSFPVKFRLGSVPYVDYLEQK
jgi:hypothetical protein